MQEPVVSLELSKKLGLVGWKQKTYFGYLGTERNLRVVRVDAAFEGFMRRGLIPAYFTPTATEIIETLPATIISSKYSGEEAHLSIRKDKETYFAWYFVVGEPDVESDLGVHASTLEDALALLWIEHKEMYK